MVSAIRTHDDPQTKRRLTNATTKERCFGNAYHSPKRFPTISFPLLGSFEMRLPLFYFPCMKKGPRCAAPYGDCAARSFCLSGGSRCVAAAKGKELQRQKSDRYTEACGGAVGKALWLRQDVVDQQHKEVLQEKIRHIGEHEPPQNMIRATRGIGRRS